MQRSPIWDRGRLECSRLLIWARKGNKGSIPFGPTRRMMKRNYTRFEVTYKSKKDGKQRKTQISADSKVQAALFLKATLASEVLRVVPLHAGYVPMV